MTPIVPVAITPGRTVSCAEVTPRSDAVSVTRVKESMMAEEEQEERFVSRLGQRSGGVKDARGKGNAWARELLAAFLSSILPTTWLRTWLFLMSWHWPSLRVVKREGAAHIFEDVLRTPNILTHC